MIISISLDEQESDRFTETAKALGISKSELFRRVWKKWIGEEQSSESQSTMKQSKPQPPRLFTRKDFSQD